MLNLKAVIFDIDGTLAIMKDRSPFEWEKVGQDEINAGVRDVLYMFKAAGWKILIFSGRDGSCRYQTERWLTDNQVVFDALVMRPEGDNRRDVIVKEEMYERMRHDFDITHVVDDRPQVCRMWHAKGLTLLKVGDPDLEF